MAGESGAYQLALRLLGRRDHSVAELARKLAARGHSTTDVNEAVARLTAIGYLDDQRFAASFAAAAMRSGRGYGPRLKLELARRGVSTEVITATLAALAEEQSEGELLAALVDRRFATFSTATADERERRRVYGYLQRRGFSLAAILEHFRHSTSSD
ncbi:MAG TPA: regulatory protein RecX [Geobacteraceae bacterium]